MQKRQLLHVSHNHWRAIMQNDSNLETKQAEIQVSFDLAERMFDNNVEFNSLPVANPV